jgi:hypothetical protein
LNCSNKEEEQWYLTLKQTTMRYCYQYYNLLLIPEPSIHGKDITVIYINDINKSDLQILFQHFLLYKIKYMEKIQSLESTKVIKVGLKRNLNKLQIEEVAELSPLTFQHLQSFIPPNFKFIAQYLIAVSCNDSNKLLSYGISPIKKQSLILSMTEAMEQGILMKEQRYFSCKLNWRLATTKI